MKPALSHNGRGRNALFGFRFRNANARWLIIWGSALLGVPFLLWLIGYLGECVVGSTASYCRYIPDIYASLLFGIYVFVVFGGWVILALRVLAAIAMVLLGAFLELEARRKTKG